MLTNKNGNKLARAMVAYLLGEMWWLHASKLYHNEARRPIYVSLSHKTIINPKINKLIKYSKLGICA